MAGGVYPWLLACIVAFAARLVQAVNFPFESIQLNQSDIANFSAIQFGIPYSRGIWGDDTPDCKVFPGDDDWPTDAEWSRLNVTLGGALMKPAPAAAVCYKGPQYNANACRYLTRLAGFTHYYLDDPLDVLTQWPEGNTCLTCANPPCAANCTQGGYPVYVVNATTVKHIQAAVNFARNKNIRLVIKNTGHDFGGRSTGAGALSIWVHNLKSFEFIPEYKLGPYAGMAVKYGAGLESWELFNYMAKHNIAVVSPGGSTVGALGGWLGFGGHSTVTSFYGLGSDQALSMEVVTADGRLVTADPFTHKDLFYALRGGGLGTYGVVTSAIMKAYPPLYMTSTSITLGVSNRPPTSITIPAPFWPNASFPHPGNGSNSSAHGAGNSSTTRPPPLTFILPPPPGFVNSSETFWQGVSLYYRHGRRVVDAGGLCFGYIYPQGKGSYTLTSSQMLPNKTNAEGKALMQPLYEDLARIGINMTASVASVPAFPPMLYGSGGRGGGGDGPAQTRYRSRLFPRDNWDDDELFNATMAAIRAGIEEGGYNFHGIMHAPTYETAGWPGRDSAVNPAWRNAVLHASLLGVQPVGLTAAQARERDARVGRYLDMWRDVTPDSGAYLNEGDPAEPDWQQSFYGDLYPALLRIKRLRDPWGLFWAPTTPGSEAWEVRAVDGYPNSQNGRLCRVENPDWGDWEP